MRRNWCTCDLYSTALGIGNDASRQLNSLFLHIKTHSKTLDTVTQCLSKFSLCKEQDFSHSQNHEVSNRFCQNPSKTLKQLFASDKAHFSNASMPPQYHRDNWSLTYGRHWKKRDDRAMIEPRAWLLTHGQWVFSNPKYSPQYSSNQTGAPCHQVLPISTLNRLVKFTDLTLDGLLLVDYYALRFQIEFNFRDAKQYFGLSWWLSWRRFYFFIIL